MAETVRLRVEVEDDSIIVTLPGTDTAFAWRDYPICGENGGSEPLTRNFEQAC
jgi:hypothetical protein